MAPPRPCPVSWACTTQRKFNGHFPLDDGTAGGLDADEPRFTHSLNELSYDIHRKDKWDSSGGNEALGRMSASIPDGTKQYVQGIFKREHIRSITVCFGIGEERAFYVEKNIPLLVERLRHNLTFFYLNYMILTAILFCLTIVTSPSTIIGIALLALAWMWFIRVSSDGSIALGRKWGVLCGMQ